MLAETTEQAENPATLVLTAPTFDQNKLLIYRELYYNGFSSVTAARDLTTGTAVALKKIDYKYFRNSPFPILRLQRRFNRKLRAQSAKIRALSHISVLKLIDFVVEPTKVTIVTEMCMFGDLFNWMLQQSQLRVRDISLVFQYLLEAIRYLHSENFIHGFLSPTHILFHSMSPQSVAIMPDLSVRNELLHLTCLALPVVDCWAPECLKQIKGLQFTVKNTEHSVADGIEETSQIELSKPMDMWSVACIMHIALTGLPPFSSDSLEEMINMLDQNAGQLRHPMFKTLSLNLCNQLCRWMELNPEARPSAGQSFEGHWFDDEQVRTDRRNLLSIIEYDLLRTCKRYRSRGRQMFESIFACNSVV